MKRLQFSNFETNDFVEGMKEAIAENPIVRPYNELKDALVISFDAEASPFSNYSKGRHKEKLYVNRPITVIERLKALYSVHRQSGGRIFIDNEYAYFFDRDSQRTNLRRLVWPKGRDVVDEIRHCWIGQRRMTITLAKVFEPVRHK